MSVPEGTEDINSMRRLWAHEVLRVYGDRLVDDDDRVWLFNVLIDTINEKLAETADVLFERLKQKGKPVNDESDPEVLFLKI